MAEATYVTDIVERTRLEILFAIKDRIGELTRDAEAPVQLQKVIIRDGGSSHRDSVRYFEVNNLYVDENNCLCGDLVCKGARFDDDVLFGKSIEDLAIDDLKLILDALYGNNWSIDQSYSDFGMAGKPSGLSALFFEKFTGITRALRRGA